MKPILSLHAPPAGHWVGDGFPVRSLFTYNGLGQQINPFLLLDYAGPTHFAPTTERRGIGQHPHRGFETVTIVYHGEVEHRDSTGGGGTIGPGDVQWMTAASGILHEEFHAASFARQGGLFEMFQLWVNLPAAHKSAQPRYQTLAGATLPVQALPGGGHLRLIAGEHGGARGPALTFSPMNVWDGRIAAGSTVDLTLPEGHIAAVVTRRGILQLNDAATLDQAHLAHLGLTGTQLRLGSREGADFLLLSAPPLTETVVGHGPFVMNDSAEIRQAYADFRAGRFGLMPATHA
ncbi:pirin family protein [Kerstersia sp.]|uniref:pirin family protein n=1 Tax=Kerstersia sp. TaxID=1930783 RepID=UPI003F8F538F